jgi:carotenoid cleavage dioxygenase
MFESSSPFLGGDYAPVHDELVQSRLPVEGELPRDLAGFLLRNGPNPQFAPIDDSLYHPFDGDGMIHSVEFADASATYRNRWVRTAGFEAERRAGRSLWGGFGSIGRIPPPPGLPLLKNLANTAFVWHAGKLLALWEAGSPHAVRLPDLATLGEESFGGGWTDAVSAHPKVDPVTGELLVFCYSVLEPPHVRYGVVDATGKVVHRTGISLRGKPVMMHDMAFTPSYSLIFDLPITFSMERVTSGGDAFAWEPENGARIGILPRYGDGADVRWFDVAVGYIFHCFNAWEEGDEVVLDACLRPRTTILAASDLPADTRQARLHQYRFHLPSGRVSERRVDDTRLEFSRIHEGYAGRKTRYGYASRLNEDPNLSLCFTAALKYDREGDRIQAVELGPERYAQEFVFAPRVGGGAEDDGYVVGFVHDTRSGQTECWVIDARRFEDGPVARVQLPRRVPYGFHSHWVPAEEAARQR